MSGAEVPRSVYFDANVFIHLIEGEAALSQPIKNLLRGLLHRNITVWTSELSLAEVLGKSSTSDDLRQQYMDLLLLSGIFSLLAVSREILLATSELRREQPFKLADAIHIASAIRSNSRALVSADRRLRRLPGQLELVSPDTHAVDAFLSSLDA